jgi:hypothetical protein
VLGEWVPEIQRVAEEERMVAACQLYQKAQSILPDDPTVLELWPQITVKGTVQTDPPGAQVTIRDCRQKEDV